jgi:preprotein translocase subunit SecA
VRLKAKELYKRDRDYIVTNGEVKIVDEFTGASSRGAAGPRASTRPSRPRRA